MTDHFDMPDAPQSGDHEDLADDLATEIDRVNQAEPPAPPTKLELIEQTQNEIEAMVSSLHRALDHLNKRNAEARDMLQKVRASL